MGTLILLLRPRFQGFRNRLSRAGGSRKRTVMLAALGAAFAVGAFVVSCRVLIHFRSAELIGDLLARHLLSMILLTFFSLLIFSHIITALSNLFLSRDLEFCHSAPVPLETVFLSRAAHTLVDSSWMVIVFGVPVFGAYGYVYGAGISFWAALLHLNLALILIAGGMGLLVTLVLVYLFPAQRTRDLLMLLSLILVVAFYFVFRFLRPERLVDPDAYFSVLQYMSGLKAARSPFIPSQWVSESLWAALTGRSHGEHLFYWALTWVSAGALLVINVWVARGLYFEGFSKSQEAKQRRRTGRHFLDIFVRGVSRPFGPRLGAVIGKDVRTFFRDNSQWTQLLLLAALVVVYIYNFSVLPLDRSPVRLDFLENELAFLNLALAGFVLAAVCARFVFTAVSAEGEAYWIIRSSPLRLRRYLWGKYVFFVLPILVLGEILVLGTNSLLQVTPFMMVLSGGTMVLIVFAVVSLGIGMGAMYPSFRFQNIAQVSTGFGGVLYMIVCCLFIGMIIVLEAGPVYLLFMSDVHGTPIPGYQWGFIIASFGAVLALGTAAVWKPMQVGLASLRGNEP